MWAYFTNYYGVDWLAMIATFFAIYLLGDKQRFGFVLGMIGNVAWFVFGIMTESMATIVANIAFFILNFTGYLKWTFRSDL